MIGTLQAAGIAVVVAGAVGFGGGWKVRDWKAGAEAAKQAQAAIEAAAEAQRTVAVADAALQAKQAERQAQFRVITREVDRVVEKPIYRNVCLDDDGLRQLAAAVGAAPADPGIAPGPMPAASSPR